MNTTVSRLLLALLAWIAPLRAEVVTASYNSSSDVPVTAGGYNASGNTVNFTLNYAPATGSSLMVVNNTSLGFIGGQFGNLTQGQVVTLSHSGVSYRFVANYFGGTGNDLVLQWADTRVYAWGGNGSGQVGSGYTSTSVSGPARVMASGVLWGKTVVSVAAGGKHTLALCSDGTVAAWGKNASGQLGNNSFSDSNVPVTVDASGVLSGKTVIAISAGLDHSLALCSDGTVAGWGSNLYGQLGSQTSALRKVPVAIDTSGWLTGITVVAIAAGGNHSLALGSDGIVFSWGLNLYGQLGNNSNVTSGSPVLVYTASGALLGKAVRAISAGERVTAWRCALMARWQPGEKIPRGSWAGLLRSWQRVGCL